MRRTDHCAHEDASPRNEDERPFPALLNSEMSGRRWAKQYQVKIQTILVLKPLIGFIVIALNSWGN
jgi:hypothetical protein